MNKCSICSYHSFSSVQVYHESYSWYLAHQCHYLCCLHFSFLLGCVRNIHHCCFCISAHCETRQGEKKGGEVKKTGATVNKGLHMHITGLCRCRRWVGHASRFPWRPSELPVCVNPLQPSSHWLRSRPCCFLYRQELLNTIAPLPLAQKRI